MGCDSTRWKKKETEKRSKHDLDFLSLAGDNNVLEDEGMHHVFVSEYMGEYKGWDKDDTLVMLMWY